MEIILLPILIPSFIYIVFMICAATGLSRLRRKTKKTGNLYTPPVSVIIAARNEEKTIGETLDCVLTQDYPKDRFEVILVNDDSSDNTARIAYEKAAGFPNLTIIDQPGRSPYASRKKYALECGIKQAKGDILILTDADSRMSKRWIRSICDCYDAEGKIGSVCSFVYLPHQRGSSFFMKFQETDYIALHLVLAGCFGLGCAVGSNGNNFSYRKSLFHEIGGFAGISDIQSGDDDLLLDKFAAGSGRKIVYCMSPDAFVETAPVTTIRKLLNQRSRWSSKIFKYKRFSVTAFGLAVFIYNLFLLLGPVLSIVWPDLAIFSAVSWLMKILSDAIMVLPRLGQLKRESLAGSFLATEFLHPAFIVYVGISGVLGNFEWKSNPKESAIKQTARGYDNVWK